MSKAIKEMLAAELRGRYSDVGNACVVELSGMDVVSQESLRISLREKNARLHVIKNSAARRAFAGTTLEPLGESLSGPCALVTSSESMVDVAKVLVEVAKKFESLKLKQAMLEGDPELLTVNQLALMKGWDELMGEIAMLVSSPGRAIAGCLQSPQGKIAGCLKAIIEKAA